MIKHVTKIIVELAIPYQRRGFNVTPETSINYELGIDGEEAVDFISAISMRTGCVISDEFDFHVYFGDEAPLSYREAIRSLRGKKREPLTIANLAEYFCK